MLSKRSIQEASLAFFLNDMIDEAELQSILEITNKKNPSFPYWKYDRIERTLDDMSESETKAEFRFATSELPRLAEALRIPEMFTCCNGATASGLEGLCILLKRFAYPCRLSDLIPRFGRSVPELSLILSEVTEHVFQNNGHLLRDLNQPWLQPRCLEEFANAIHQKGAALDNCWGFVDGTVRPISRPGQNQRVMYNGHKRVHAIKFQSVVSPNGLIANLYGPVGKLVLQFFGI